MKIVSNRSDWYQWNDETLTTQGPVLYLNSPTYLKGIWVKYRYNFTILYAKLKPYGRASHDSLPKIMHNTIWSHQVGTCTPSVLYLQLVLKITFFWNVMPHGLYTVTKISREFAASTTGPKGIYYTIWRYMQKDSNLLSKCCNFKFQVNQQNEN
jgi:hypothetical protein